MRFCYHFGNSSADDELLPFQLCSCCGLTWKKLQKHLNIPQFEYSLTMKKLILFSKMFLATFSDKEKEEHTSTFALW